MPNSSLWGYPSVSPQKCAAATIALERAVSGGQLKPSQVAALDPQPLEFSVGPGCIVFGANAERSKEQAGITEGSV
jgi:hypothetical protein